MLMQKRSIHDQSFTAQHTSNSITNVLLRNCVFDNCSVGVPFLDPTAPMHELQHDLTRRPLVSALELVNCVTVGSAGCGLMGAIVEETTVDGLQTDGLVQ